MVVRGAPAIGVTAAYGVALASLEFRSNDLNRVRKHIADAVKMLSKTRPTAVNLFWALARMQSVSDRHIGTVSQ